MARKSSTKSGSQKSQDESATSDVADTVADTVGDTVSGSGEMGGDTVLVGDDTRGEDAVATEHDANDRVTIEPGDAAAAESISDDPAATEIRDAEPAVEETAPPPAPTPEPVVVKRGPGIGALLIGGVVAAALGYGAAIFGFAGSNDTTATDTALAEAVAAIDAQQGTISALEAQVVALAAVEPPVIPEVDLSGVEASVAAVASDVAGVSSSLSGVTTSIEALTARVAVLEDRPIFTGEMAEDSAAMIAAVDALETRLTEERTAAAEAVAEAEATQAAAEAAAQAAQAEAAAEVQAAADASDAAIAQAEATAQEMAAATQAEAALTRVEAALAAGEPFAEVLADLPGETPEALAAAAEAGVATLEELQAAYPAAARAALPIALRETAGDSAADRVGAFLLGQIGGRSIEPREGDGPDAVLSRAEAAVAAGDLPTALTEISALPEGAQAMLDDWVTQVETRVAADAALAEISATLEN